MVNQALSAYWTGDRLQASLRLASADLIDPTAQNPIDLSAAAQLLLRSYGLNPTAGAEVLKALSELQPYRAYQAASSDIRVARRLLQRWPDFIDLFLLAFPEEELGGASRLLGVLAQRFPRRSDQLIRVAARISEYPSAFSRLLQGRIDAPLYGQPETAIQQLQCCWHWNQTSKLQSFLFSHFCLPRCDIPATDFGSRVFTFLALEERALRLFCFLNQRFNADQALPPHLVSSLLFLAVANGYPDRAMASDVADRVRSAELPQHLHPKPPKPQALHVDERPVLLVVSPDFRHHPVGRFWLPIHQHLHRHYRLHCLSLRAGGDSLEQCYQQHCTAFHSASPLAHDEVVAIVNRVQPQILLDLAGHTADNVFPLFNYRFAPVQATYLGYFGPSFAGEMDWWIVDDSLEPFLHAEPALAEKRWRLPCSHLVYDVAAHGAPALQPVACSWGNPRIGSFNHSRKLSPDFISLSARLLDDAHLNASFYVKSHSFADASVKRWMAQRFQDAGVPIDRTVFLPFAPTPTDHFLDFHRIDVHLDSTPVCGTTTTLDALCMGVPVITRPTGLYAGSVSAGILAALELHDWILPAANDQSLAGIRELIQRHCAQANNRAALARDVRQRLADACRTSPAVFADQLRTMLRAAAC